MINVIIHQGWMIRVNLTTYLRAHAPREDVLKFEEEYGNPTSWSLDTEKLFYETFYEWIPTDVSYESIINS